MRTLQQKTQGVLEKMEEIKTKKRKSMKKRMVLGFMAALVIFCGGYIMTNLGMFRTLKYDRVLGSAVHTKINNSQFVPEEKAFKNIAEENVVDELKHEEYVQILDNLSNVQGYGAGKYLGYDMNEIKSEYLFVLEKAPVFDQWFQFGSMRGEQGYTSIPYYEGWSYFITSDSEAENVEITRVTWRTRFDYYDFDKNEVIEDYDENRSVIQYEVSKVKFYENENNEEVVESTIYGVAVDNFKKSIVDSLLGFVNEENFNQDNYKPLYYTRFVNVKDKSLTKYTLNVSQLTHVESDVTQDIRELSPYGSSREFIYLNYEDKDNVQLLRLDQVENTSHSNLPTTGKLSFYNKSGTSVQGYFSSYDYYDSLNSTLNVNLNKHWTISSSKVNLLETFNIQKIYNAHRADSNYLNKVMSKDEVTRGLKIVQPQGNVGLLREKLNNSISEIAKFANLEESVINSYKQVNESSDISNVNNFIFEENIDILMNKVSKNIVEDIDIKNDWNRIFRGIETSSVTVNIPGVHDPKKQPVESFHNLVTGNYYGKNLIVSAYADLIEGRGIDENNSLSLVLINEHNDIVVLASSYDSLKESHYSNGDLIGRHYSVNQSVYFDNLKISKAGTYSLKFVLTSKVGNEEVLAYDINQYAYLLHFSTFDLADSINADNTVSSYEMNYQGRKLEVKVTVS